MKKIVHIHAPFLASALSGQVRLCSRLIKNVSLFLVFLLAVSTIACADEEPLKKVQDGASAYFGGKRVLVAYFSWGGTTQRMAQQIQDITGADVFRIEPEVPYPTEYTPCTEVALEEKNNNSRPAIKNRVENWNDYDVVFIGCPVWWWTTPMIIHTFAESYDFNGKTVVPFCTYAATYRDETLAEIVDITPDAAHLTGEGLTSGSINTQRIQAWIDLIDEEWNINNSADHGDAVMNGKVNLWTKGNIPTVTRNANNSDGPDFIPNIEVFTVAESVTPKGAVMICPGGAFAFRSMQNEGYDIADMLVPMGYQCFIVNYRILPYTMQESATDLQRAIRYVKVHAEDYRIDPENIALVGFSAGGILNGEVLLNWRDLTNGKALDSAYVPDELDNVPVSACAVGMIYAFYGRLSVSMNDVETLRNANLPPAFYCWGTRDGFAGQFTRNADAVEQAGCRVERKILPDYPHGYGTGGSPDVWGKDFDMFLMSVMSDNSAVARIIADSADNEIMFDMQGRIVNADAVQSGLYIVRNSTGTKKILRR